MKMKYAKLLGLVSSLLVCYLVADHLLTSKLQPINIEENGIYANFFAKPGARSETTVVFIGGGQWGDHWSRFMMEHDMVGLSLPYTGIGDLPMLPEEIELEYFEKALRWLTRRSEVDKGKIIVAGASRNAELALLIAARFRNLDDHDVR